MLNLGNIIPQGSNPGLSGALVFHTTFAILLSPGGEGGTAPSAFQDVSGMFGQTLGMITIHYDDHISFQTDNLEIICSDIGDRLINNSSINKGAWLKIQIHQWNAQYPGSHTMMDTGSFQIDQIKQTGPPSQTVIMATSVPISSAIKLTLRNRTLFASSVHDLATLVANESDLKLKWEVDDTKQSTLQNTMEQWNESDLQMLSRYCKQHALGMKVRDVNLIVFDEQILEQKPPVYTIDFGDSRIFSFFSSGVKTPGLEHWDLTTQSQDIYSLATLDFFDWYSGQTTTLTVQAPPGTAIGSGEVHKSYGDPGSPDPNTPGNDLTRLA